MGLGEPHMARLPEATPTDALRVSTLDPCSRRILLAELFRRLPFTGLLQRLTTMDAPARLEIAGPDNRRFPLTCSPVRQADGQIFLLELVSDVTEQERLHQRLGAVERLAAVGELAAGLVHDIRNPLAAILDAATLLEEAATLTAEERATILAAVKTEARRLNTTLSGFLLFARPRLPTRQLGDVGKVVEHVSALLQEERNRQAGV